MWGDIARPDAEAYEKNKMDALSAEAKKHLK
jgi:hypothetical protein